MAQPQGGTIFAPVSKEDPKHGRWILPLVVLALVLFTYTFVTNLPAAETPTTTTAAATERTTTTAPPEETTTTTLAPEVVAFVATVDSLASEADDLSATAQTVNDEYPDTTGYGGTRDALGDLRVTTEEFGERVGAVVVPTGAVDEWGDVTTAATAMQLAADEMLDGLVNTSGSETRLGALEQYNIAAAALTQALDKAKTAATEPAATP